jgi:hypothetical protein
MPSDQPARKTPSPRRRQRKTPSTPAPFAPADEALHAEVGIPVGALAVRITEPGLEFGQSWKDYTVELVGEVMGTVGPDDDAPQFPWQSLTLSPRDGSVLTTPDGTEIVRDPSADPYLVRVWRCRVHCAGVPGFVESRYLPDPGGVLIRLLGLDGPDYDRANRALRGITLLALRTSSRGRPPGSGAFSTRDEFRDALIEAIDKLEYDRDAITQEHIAHHLGISARTLTTYLRRFGIDWTRDVKGTRSKR